AAGLAVPLTFLKFSRGAEEEADRLGAQYMWAAGYDPHAMVTFFEKLEAKGKKKPGTIAKAFSTHPMTSDRIKEVGNLVARFPDKQEHEISSAEFDSVKSRLISINAMHRPEDAASGSPTLNCRPAPAAARRLCVAERSEAQEGVMRAVPASSHRIVRRSSAAIRRA